MRNKDLGVHMHPLPLATPMLQATVRTYPILNNIHAVAYCPRTYMCSIK